MRLPRHLPAITGLIEPPDIIFAAEERLAASTRRPGWFAWACGVALLLHVLVLALALYTREKPLPEDAAAQQSVSVTLDNGTAPQNTAPPAPFHGQPQPAQSPATPPPPPAAQQPEVNLNLPENLLATLPPPPPQPHAAPRPRSAPAHHYVMLLNGMSYGTSPSTPTPPAPPGANMSLPQSDAEAAMSPDVQIKGDAGPDWGAALVQWVNDNKKNIYPDAAVEQNQQGDVVVEFTADRTGKVTGLHLVGLSNSVFLNAALMNIFQGENVHVPPFPANARDNSVVVDFTMHYILGP